jgi:hypothetical protein
MEPLILNIGVNVSEERDAPVTLINRKGTAANSPEKAG